MTLMRAHAGVIVDNSDMMTGMEKKEEMGTADIFWSREPIMGPRGTKENPAIIPSFNSSRCVGLETEQARRLRTYNRRCPSLAPQSPRSSAHCQPSSAPPAAPE